MGKNKKNCGEAEHSLVQIHDNKQRKKVKKERNAEEGPHELPTVSIAVAGSIIDNTQSFELATRLAGQIARAATIFRIDEVVVFENNPASESNQTSEDESGAMFLIKILQYLETPQYLRKALFPMSTSLKFVGLLPPLDAPHHLRKHEWGPFREGVTLKGETPNSNGTLVDVGLSKNVVVNEAMNSGRRVTVAMGKTRNLDDDSPRQVVSSSKPREESGTYWGYRVRHASNLSSAIIDSPYSGGYDLKIGTSEHGDKICSSKLSFPRFRHLLIAFGGLAGLEESIEEDSKFKGRNAKGVFDSYINTCPRQGSRTIRTEEALFISLQYFQDPIDRAIGKSHD